jgi:hypothetical protein
MMRVAGTEAEDLVKAGKALQIANGTDLVKS